MCLVTYLNSRSYFLIYYIYFCFMIIYVIVLHWILICRLEVSFSLNWGPDPSILIDLTFLIVRFDQFQF